RAAAPARRGCRAQGHEGLERSADRHVAPAGDYAVGARATGRVMLARVLSIAFARGGLLALIGLAAGGSGLAAQDPTSPTVAALIETAADTARRTIFLRAQRLVNDGNGAEGRALLDSLLNATEPRAPEEAEILFWRATLAESW